MDTQQRQGLFTVKGLATAELAAIEQLATICNAYEQLDLKLNWNVLRARPHSQVNDFLYYENGLLVGFLALFAFNTQEAEISGMVHPEYRRKGIFTQLLQAAREECHSRGLPDLLFIVEHSSESGQGFAASLTPAYDHSEYKMILDQERVPAPLPTQLEFRRAQEQDIQILQQITATAFDIPEQDVTWYTPEKLQSNGENEYFVALLDGDYVGKIDLAVTAKLGWIFGFAVLPHHQRRGYGRQILSATIQHLLARKPEMIALEVATANENALALYQSCGFEVTSRYDYYRLSV